MKTYLRHSVLLAKQLIIILLLFTVCRFFFFTVNYQYFSEIPIPEFIKILFIGFHFDLSTLIAFNFPLILVQLAPGNFKDGRLYRSVTRWLFVVINATLFLTDVSDARFFEFTQKRSSADVFDLIAGGNETLGLIPQFAFDYWYVLLVWFAMLFVLIRFLPVSVKKIEAKKKYTFSRFLSESGLFVLFIAILFVAYRGTGIKPLWPNTAAKYTKAQYVPLLQNTPFCLLHTFFMKDQLTERKYFDKEELVEIYTPEKQYQHKRIDKKNVVIIILESFSAEYSGFYKHLHLSSPQQEDTYTPFLDSLALHSLTFKHSYANGKRSMEAMPAIFASIPTLMDAPYIVSRYATNIINSLPSLLKDEGYFSAFFHGGKNGTMSFDKFAGTSGFDKYYGMDEYPNKEHFDGSWGISDEEYLQYFSETINDFKQPFLASVFTVSSHHPYKLPKKHKGHFPKGIHPIHKTIGYTDYALRLFFEKASKEKWFNNTLFVITADHTAQTQHKQYKTKTGIYSVPIIYYAPADSSLIGIDSVNVTQQSDIMPSVLDYLNYNKQFVSFGNSVFDDSENHFAINFLNGSYQLIEDNYSLIFDGQNAKALYNLSDDKMMKNNIVSKSNSSEIVIQKGKLIKAIIQEYNYRLISNKYQ